MSNFVLEYNVMADKKTPLSPRVYDIIMKYFIPYINNTGIIINDDIPITINNKLKYISIDEGCVMYKNIMLHKIYGGSSYTVEAFQDLVFIIEETEKSTLLKITKIKFVNHTIEIKSVIMKEYSECIWIYVNKRKKVITLIYKHKERSFDFDLIPITKKAPRFTLILEENKLAIYSCGKPYFIFNLGTTQLTELVRYDIYLVFTNGSAKQLYNFIL